MITIDWSQAPEWANYVAMDEDGQVFWHEKKPKDENHGEWFASDSRYESVARQHQNTWRDSLQQRPEADK